MGTWISAEEGETLEFRADGTLYFTTADGLAETLRWQADDRSLALVVEERGHEDTEVLHR